MRVNSIKTHKISSRDNNLFAILDRYLLGLRERSVVVITSKIVSICEGRVIKIGTVDKDELVRREAEYFLPKETNRYQFFLTIKNGILCPTAGIDESNGNGYYILWPENPQKTANEVRAYLSKKFSLKRVGVIITDSKTTPLRWGVTGTALAHSGFSALNDYRGKKDIFGRILKVTQVNAMDALASAAVLVMGEGREQTPLALIEDVPFVKFQNRNPTKQELKNLRIDIKEDIYSSLLTSVKWKKGEKAWKPSRFERT
ncbi:MAG: coenzyme F420-0:L-glutamate ligase [Patescibacteria group bacterium]